MREKIATALLGFVVLVCPTLSIGSVWPSVEKAINGVIEKTHCERVQGRCK